MPSTLAAVDVLARHGGGKGPFGFLFLLLILAAIAAGVMLLRRRRGGTAAGDPTPPAPPAPSGGDARALLDQRFAQGEIDQAEYEHRRAVLTGDSPAAPAPPAGDQAEDE